MTEIITKSHAAEEQCAALILKTVQSEGKDGFQENGENRVRVLVQLQDLEQRMVEVKERMQDPPIIVTLAFGTDAAQAYQQRKDSLAELQNTLKQAILEEYKIIHPTLEGAERMDQGTEKKMYQIITELRYLIEVLKRSCG